MFRFQRITADRIQYWLADLLFSAAMLLAGGLVPPVHAEISAFAVPVLLFTGLLVLVPGESLRPRHILLLPVLLLCGMVPVPFQAFAVLALLTLLQYFFPEHRRTRFWVLLGTLNACYGLLLWIPQFFFFFEAFSALLSWILSLFGGHDLFWGDSASAIHVLLFFVLRAAASWLLSGRLKKLASLPISAALFLVLLTLFIRLSAQAGAPGAQLQLGIFLILFLADSPFPIGDHRPRSSLRWSFLIVPILAGLLLILGIGGPPAASVEDLRIGFRSAGLWSPEIQTSEKSSPPSTGRAARRAGNLGGRGRSAGR